MNRTSTKFALDKSTRHLVAAGIGVDGERPPHRSLSLPRPGSLWTKAFLQTLSFVASLLMFTVNPARTAASPGDDSVLLIRKCGKPDSIDSTDRDSPRPPSRLAGSSIAKPASGPCTLRVWAKPAPAIGSSSAFSTRSASATSKPVVHRRSLHIVCYRLIRRWLGFAAGRVVVPRRSGTRVWMRTGSGSGISMPIEELSPSGQFSVLLNQFLSLFVRGRRRKVGAFAAIWALIGLCLLPFFAVLAFAVVYGPRFTARVGKEGSR